MVASEVVEDPAGRYHLTAEVLDIPGGPRCRLGESPRWDGQAWWWVDAAPGEVWRWRPGGAAALVRATGVRTSLVHPAVGGGVVVARETELVVFEPAAHGGQDLSRSVRSRELGESGDQAWGGSDPVARSWVDLELPPGWLVNDGTADSQGRLWIGSIAPARAPRGGALLRVERDGRVAEAARGFTLTNGMAWVDDVLYHADTFERVIWRHRVDLASGEVRASEPFVTYAADDGMPDGLATDSDGGVWAAIYGRGEVRRYAPTGSCERVVAVAAPQATSVALGAGELLVTTAQEGYDEERSKAEPQAGRLFGAAIPYVGTPTQLVAPQ